MQEALNGCEYRGDIIGRRPSILQDVETQFSVRVNVRMEHARKEFDGGRFGRIALVESEDELEGAILKWCVHYAAVGFQQ